jgi:uncharacterized membrane protein YbjE (DUF340 family)
MLNPQQRRWLADKLGDLANLAIAALIFGQLTSDRFRPGAAVVGLILLIIVFFYGRRLLKNLD